MIKITYYLDSEKFEKKFRSDKESIKFLRKLAYLVDEFNFINFWKSGCSNNIKVKVNIEHI